MCALFLLGMVKITLLGCELILPGYGLQKPIVLSKQPTEHKVILTLLMIINESLKDYFANVDFVLFKILQWVT